MQAWNTVETAEKDLKVQQTTVQEQQETYKEEKKEKEQKLKDLHQQYKELEGQRSGTTDSIPEEWLSTYEHMRGRVPDPVVEVDRGSCSGT